MPVGTRKQGWIPPLEFVIFSHITYCVRIDIMADVRKVKRAGRRARAKRYVIVGAVLLVLLLVWLGVFAPARSFDAQLKSIVRPHQFSVVGWEVQAIPGEIKQLISRGRGSVQDESASVIEYFSLTERIRTLSSGLAYGAQADGNLTAEAPAVELSRLQAQKAAQTGTVEKILEKQIGETLSGLGIFNPVVGLRFGFPPVNFRLESPPDLLVISPRDRIESMREITLKPGLTREDVESIESRADGLGVSALVVRLGGLGSTYPTFVADDGSLQSVIEAAVHEWLHQYLTFKPLGFLYLLDLTGLRRDYDVAVMNETLAGMLAKEIGDMVYAKYYAPPSDGAGQNPAAVLEFDFDAEMRDIRRAVDSYLARGEIEQAEKFMEQKRRYLFTMSYDIRKLNQAYFAFYGTYADSPTSINPIGSELKKLREQSVSLKKFLDTAAAMTSRQQLTDSLAGDY